MKLRKYTTVFEEAQRLFRPGEIKKAAQLLSQLKKEHKEEVLPLKPYTVENLKRIYHYSRRAENRIQIP